jgi:hemerythrin
MVPGLAERGGLCRRQTIIDQNLHQNVEDQYQKLNKKLVKLNNNNNKHNNTQKTTQFQAQVINLSNVHFTKEQTRLLSWKKRQVGDSNPSFG